MPSPGKWRADCGRSSCDSNPCEAEARGLPGVQGLLVILLAWVHSKTLYQGGEESPHGYYLDLVIEEGRKTIVG